VTKLVDDVIQIVYDKYLSLNAAEYAALKQVMRSPHPPFPAQSLCRFYERVQPQPTLPTSEPLCPLPPSLHPSPP
jgi:hypothetical protein